MTPVRGWRRGTGEKQGSLPGAARTSSSSLPPPPPKATPLAPCQAWTDDWKAQGWHRSRGHNVGRARAAAADIADPSRQEAICSPIPQVGATDTGEATTPLASRSALDIN
ncbi:hypothetical protein PVAP13_7KG244855 [Panicum virgatum]|uniref:Uncharacterized protein n=1 Tax=Panicum virgatum TaxID=38727 RepID=A0A8T0QHS0_PANVG|nr:hypothetical protein PVAP13_7KG244855 [Panicum virgatum]